MKKEEFACMLIVMLNVYVIAIECDNSHLKYDFAECKYGKRKMLFWWDSANCTNTLPPPLENLTCEVQCPEGKYLGYSSDAKTTTCLDCPINTFSTGSALRFSSLDANWGSLPKNVELLCYWVTADGFWTCQPCASFKVNSDGTAFVWNSGAIKPNTWNILEFSLNSYLYDQGKISFEYKKLSKQELGFINGKFRFDIGMFNMLHDEDSGQTTTQSFSIPLEAGYKEFRWYYFFSSRADISHLYTEISKIEISPVNYAPLFCTPCLIGNSGTGSSLCTHCNANYYLDSSTSKCIACPEKYMAYPGQEKCTQRPTCSFKYDTIKTFTECKNRIRTMSYSFRPNTICDTSTPLNYNGPSEFACNICKPGYKISGDTCEKCPPGMYTLTENSGSCSDCPAGSHAKLVEIYEAFEEFPSSFDTYCENTRSSINYCSLHRGWIVADPDLAPPPHLPPGVNLILRLNLTIVATSGMVSFQYSVSSTQSKSKEQLYIRVDGETTSLPMENSGRPKEIHLFKGAHVFEWIYSVSEDAPTL